MVNLCLFLTKVHNIWCRAPINCNYNRKRLGMRGNITQILTNRSQLVQDNRESAVDERQSIGKRTERRDWEKSTQRPNIADAKCSSPISNQTKLFSWLPHCNPILKPVHFSRSQSIERTQSKVLRYICKCEGESLCFFEEKNCKRLSLLYAKSESKWRAGRFRNCPVTSVSHK